MSPSALAAPPPPAVLSLGLRPFFLAGAIHAAVVVLGGFALVYGPMLWRPRADARS